MQMSGPQLKQFHAALLSAFPTSSDLEQMVSFELDKNLHEIAGGQNHSDVVFNLLKWAKKEGMLKDLLKAAIETVPNNSQLSAFADEIQKQPMSQPSATPKPADGKVTVFFAYAEKDEELRDELATHLSGLKRRGLIEEWHDQQIIAGSDRTNEMDNNLVTADVILLLVSANFLNSDYCYDEAMTLAMERHRAGDAIVIPIILKPSDWTKTPFSKLQALPKNAKPVTSWNDKDEAFLNIAQGIGSAIERLKQSRQSS